MVQSCKIPEGEVEIRPNWRVALRVWWSIAWRAGVLGVVAGGTMKLALNLLGREDENLVLAAMGVSLVISVGLEVWLIHHALTHQYGSFRIAVMKKNHPGSESL